MSDPAERPALRRPPTARPRADTAPAVDAPSHVELEAIERQLAVLPTYSGATLDEVPELEVLLVRRPGLGTAMNFATHLRWPQAEAGRRLALLEERQRSAGEWPALLTADGLTEPADLPTWLAATGWVEIESERVMWTRRPPRVPHLDPQLRIEAVTRRSAVDVERLERDVFGLAAERAAERSEQLAAAVEEGRLRAFALRAGGAVVASARLAAGDGVAAIFGVGVLAGQRRQGYGALVTAIATRAGLASGGGLVWLSVDERNSPAVELYRGLGYQATFAWHRWVSSAER
jgi:ribosomal protein S18 acetylase RimI-like enzyme